MKIEVAQFIYACRDFLIFNIVSWHRYHSNVHLCSIGWKLVSRFKNHYISKEFYERRFVESYTSRENWNSECTKRRQVCRERSEGAVSRNEDVCEKSESHCLLPYSKGARSTFVYGTKRRQEQGTLDTGRRNQSGVNDNGIARGFIYFVRAVFRFFLLQKSQENLASAARDEMEML